MVVLMGGFCLWFAVYFKGKIGPRGALVLLLAALGVLAFLYLELYLMARKNGDSLSDEVVIDGTGIALYGKRREPLVFPWGDIAELTQERRSFSSPRLVIKNRSAEELWFTSDGQAEKYIFQQHPELKPLLTRKRIS